MPIYHSGTVFQRKTARHDTTTVVVLSSGQLLCPLCRWDMWHFSVTKEKEDITCIINIPPQIPYKFQTCLNKLISLAIPKPDLYEGTQSCGNVNGYAETLI